MIATPRESDDEDGGNEDGGVAARRKRYEPVSERRLKAVLRPGEMVDEDADWRPAEPLHVREANARAERRARRAAARDGASA